MKSRTLPLTYAGNPRRVFYYGTGLGKDQHIKVEVWSLPSAHHFLNITLQSWKTESQMTCIASFIYLFIYLLIYLLCVCWGWVHCGGQRLGLTKWATTPLWIHNCSGYVWKILASLFSNSWLFWYLCALFQAYPGALLGWGCGIYVSFMDEQAIDAVLSTLNTKKPLWWGLRAASIYRDMALEVIWYCIHLAE